MLNLPPGCYKGINNSKSGTTPFLEKRQFSYATKTFTEYGVTVVSYFLNTNTESNHFPVPILGRFLNQLWPNVSRTEGAQKSKMEKKTMWKCHLEERPGTEKKLWFPYGDLQVQTGRHGADGIWKTWWNELPSHEKTWRNLHAKWKKPIWKDSNYRTCWKSQNYGDSKKTSGYQRLTGKEGWVSKHRHFGSREIILKLSWWIHTITVKSHRMYTHWTLMETMDFS